MAPETDREGHGDLDDATLRSYATAVAVAWAVFGGMHLVGGRPITAAAHVAAALLSLGARVLVRPSAGIRTLPILTLACGSLAGLGAAAVLSADPRGPAVTLLALVPLLTGVVRARRLRRGILVLAIATTAAVPFVAAGVPVLEPFVVSVTESVLMSLGLGLLVYRLGSEWRLRSDAQVSRLAAQQAELEGQQARLQESTAELSAARDEAIRASAAKSRFVAMTSHEIRGPLNGLVGLSHALSDTELSPHQRGIVGALRTSSDALTKVVGELLDLARVEAGRVVLAPSVIDIREVVEDVADTFCAAASEKQVEIAAVVATDVPDAVMLDASRLRQVVSNLVGNAVKFTDRGHVLIAVGREGSELVIEVSDTGRGISAEDRERVFAPFEQVSDKLLDRQAGTGLGLWLGRTFVDAMGGSLEVRSELGVGSTFVIRLPCERVSIPEIDRTSQLPAAKILGMIASPIAGRSLVAAAARLGLSAELAMPAAPATHTKGVFDHVIVDVDDPAQESRVTGAARLPRAGGGAYVAASPHRIARAEELARRHKLAGVLLKPIRSARLAALLSPDGAKGPQTSSSGTLLLGHLLVIDDEPLNRTVVRHLATPLGLTVAEAASGEAALEWLAKNPCDVVLVDLHMDGLDGAQTADRIRARHGATPVLIGYSGVVRDDERARFHESGVVDVLGKPLDRPTFETALRAAFARSRRRQTRAGDTPAAAPAQRASPEAIAAALGLTTGRAAALSKSDALEVARLAELVKFMGDTQARNMTAEMLGDLDERVAAVTAGARAGSPAAVEAAAHKLASVAATFGMNRLAEACRAAEGGARDASPAQLRDLGGDVLSALPPARAALMRALAEWPPSA